MKIVALAGGVGGAKLAEGLAQALPPEALTVVVNTGDDFEHFGLAISPDLDTVCYKLAGLENPETGWGRAGESWQAIESAAALGGPDWFRLGDRDLGTHLERTRRLRQGDSLSAITRDFCQAWGVQVAVIPMSDQPVRTMVSTGEGILAFQEYFVHRRCQPEVQGFTFTGVESAQPAPGVLEALDQAQAVVICPSNPWVSVDPILSIPGIKAALRGRPVVAVSPIIAGQALKGPAAKMYTELGIGPSALAVARHDGLGEQKILAGFVLDQLDRDQIRPVADLGLETLATNTVMKSSEDRLRLAAEVLKFVSNLL